MQQAQVPFFIVCFVQPNQRGCTVMVLHQFTAPAPHSNFVSISYNPRSYKPARLPAPLPLPPPTGRSDAADVRVGRGDVPHPSERRVLGVAFGELEVPNLDVADVVHRDLKGQPDRSNLVDARVGGSGSARARRGQ